jgi:hypothetical protein
VVKSVDLLGTIVAAGTGNGFEEYGADLGGFVTAVEEMAKGCLELGADVILVGAKGDNAETEAIDYAEGDVGRMSGVGRDIEMTVHPFLVECRGNKERSIKSKVVARSENIHLSPK